MGHLKKAFVVEGEEVGSLKSERKRTRGGGWSSLFVRPLFEKICLIFQTANRVAKSCSC